MSHEITPFESIRRTNPAGNEFWSSRDFAKVLGYADYRNFQAIIESRDYAIFQNHGYMGLSGGLGARHPPLADTAKPGSFAA